jgi:hypothetical protein
MLSLLAAQTGDEAGTGSPSGPRAAGDDIGSSGGFDPADVAEPVASVDELAAVDE